MIEIEDKNFNFKKLNFWFDKKYNFKLVPSFEQHEFVYLVPSVKSQLKGLKQTIQFIRISLFQVSYKFQTKRIR